MRNTLLGLLFGLFVVVGLAGQAQAVTVTTDLSAVNGTLINLDSPGAGITLDLSKAGTGGGLVSGTVSGVHVTPVNPFTNTAVTGNYLSASANGKITLTVTKGIASISFIWGTIDTYNKVDLLDAAGNVVSTIAYVYNSVTKTGSFVNQAGVALSIALSDIVTSTTSKYVTISGLTGIYSVVFESLGSNAMEVAGVRIAAVPLPAAFPLFGFALMGLAARKRRKAA